MSLVEPVVVMDKPDETESVIDPTPEQRAPVEQPVPEPAERAGVVGKTVVIGLLGWARFQKAIM